MHIDTTQTSGHSKNSLSEAIANAIGDALGETAGDGDHQISLTVIVDGYEFDGEEYHVNVRVMILDYTASQHELYEQLQNDDTPDLANDMTAAIYGKRAFDADDDRYANDMENYLENTYMEEGGIGAFTMIANPMTHDHLEMEAGYFERRGPEPEPANKNSGPEPSPGGFAGGGSGQNKGEEAA